MAWLTHSCWSRQGVYAVELANAWTISQSQRPLQSGLAVSADGIVRTLLANRRASQTSSRSAVVVVAWHARAHRPVHSSEERRRTVEADSRRGAVLAVVRAWQTVDVGGVVVKSVVTDTLQAAQVTVHARIAVGALSRGGLA